MIESSQNVPQRSTMIPPRITAQRHHLLNPPQMLATVLACLAFLGAILMVWQWLAAWRFPLQQRSPPSPAPFPSISVLKPVTGADPGTAEALASWLQQAYPGPIEILFGVASPNDPAFPLIQQLLRRHPVAQARLVLCPDHSSLNRKVDKLIHLAQEASGQIVVVSDADVFAPADLLAQAVPLLRDPQTGLVHCLYRVADAPTLATRWEAFIVNVDFWSQVLQNKSFRPIDYALGAVMMFRRIDLDALGGFRSLAGVLADDNRLGRLIVERGLRTHLCPIVVDCRAAPMDWVSTWRHQLRWAITIRVCQPGSYFLSILANGTIWPLLWAIAAPSGNTVTIATGLILLRILQALALESRFTGRPPDWAAIGLAPLKDILQVGLWSTAFLRSHVVWRDAHFRVSRDGRLHSIPVSGVAPDPSGLAENAPRHPLASSGFGIPPRNR